MLNEITDVQATFANATISKSISLQSLLNGLSYHVDNYGIEYFKLHNTIIVCNDVNASTLYVDATNHGMFSNIASKFLVFGINRAYTLQGIDFTIKTYNSPMVNKLATTKTKTNGVAIASMVL